MSRQPRPLRPTMLAHWKSNLHPVGLHSAIVMTRSVLSDRVKRVNLIHVYSRKDGNLISKPTS